MLSFCFCSAAGEMSGRDERQTESLGRKWKDIEGLDHKIFQLRELIGHREAER